VPEKRREVTTEGGLDVARNKRRIGVTIDQLKKAGIRVSLFIEPSLGVVKLSKQLGADAVEFHTGRFCMAAQGALGARSKTLVKSELERLRTAAVAARKAGLHVHAGHGFDYENVRPVVELQYEGSALIEEYNIGHAIVCRAAMVGLERAVREMLAAVQAP
jgi:pyridoxine 5-phosphate synthase